MIHIYTGDGKGKTTSALGLALRAIGAQKKVAIIQFLKKSNTSEYQAIKKFRLPILIESFGIGFYFGVSKRRKNLEKIYKIFGDDKPQEEHQKAAQKALERTRQIVKAGDFDLVILDEINVAIDYQLIALKEVMEIINLNKKTELVLTGRNAHSELKKLANLVTVMKKNKHYFDLGTKARKGIEY